MISAIRENIKDAKNNDFYTEKPYFLIPPEKWPGTEKQWIDFQICIKNNPTDHICDSCWIAIFKRKCR
jgi:hypothetical protein